MFGFKSRYLQLLETIVKQNRIIIQNENLILAKLDIEGVNMGKVEDAIAALRAEVEAETSVEQSAIKLIQSLADQVLANVGDPDAILEVVAKIKASSDALAAAVVANTEPAAPAQ